MAKSEDCLYLNVWAPTAALGRAGSQRLPVMVWSFGGSFTAGSGNIDGAALARKGVVVVSFNYRVSTFGFLAHPQLSAESPDRVSGNFGLLDAIAALQWVQTNIKAFGGDPHRVTLWGQSSGASVITALLVSTAPSGLFQQVILESPGAMRHWKPLHVAEQEGVALGADIAALRALPAADVPLVQNLAGARGVRPLFEPRVIGPILDGRLLKEEERERFESGRALTVRALIGNNTDEGATFTTGYQIRTTAAYREYLANPAIFGSAASEAFGLYPVTSDAEVPRAIADSFGDSQFYFGAQGIARALARAKGSVYRYRFTRKSDGGSGHDPWHGAEIPYVMGTVAGKQYNDDDRALSNVMMDAWTRFASTGDPSGGAVATWPRYDATSDPYLVLDIHPVVERGLRNGQLDFIGRMQRATKR